MTGDADQLAQLSEVDTDPIPMTGVSADETVQAALALPTGVVAVKDEPVSVTIQIRPVTGTRTFSAGLQLIGESATCPTSCRSTASSSPSAGRSRTSIGCPGRASWQRSMSPA